MGHPGGMLDQRLDRAERLREREQAGAGDDVEGQVLVEREEAHHAAEVAHLAGGDLGRPGIQHLGDRVVPRNSSTIARAFSQWARMRTASVFTPRSTR